MPPAHYLMNSVSKLQKINNIAKIRKKRTETHGMENIGRQAERILSDSSLVTQPANTL